MAAVQQDTREALPPHNRLTLSYCFALQLLDVCGPLDCLNVLQYDHPMKLSVIGPGPTLDPVTTRVPNAPNNLFSEALVTTHTYEDPPSDVDAVFVPGGLVSFRFGSDLIAELEL